MSIVIVLYDLGKTPSKSYICSLQAHISPNTFDPSLVDSAETETVDRKNCRIDPFSTILTVNVFCLVHPS